MVNLHILQISRQGLPFLSHTEGNSHIFLVSFLTRFSLVGRWGPNVLEGG